MKKAKSKREIIFESILNDQRLRQEVVKKRFDFFFPIYLHQYLSYKYAPFHKEIMHILEDDSIKLAVITAFRGSAKSTIITTAYVLWSILGVQQKKFVVINGQTEEKARVYLKQIKDQLLDNTLLKNDLGPFEEERNSLGNATALIIKKLNAKIMISSVEKSIRGMKHGEHRPDLIILDDIEDSNSVKTRESRDKTFNWLTSEVIPAGVSKTKMIVVGNLLHEDSVLKRLQKKIEHGEMKYVKSVYREYPIVDEKNNPLWPGKYPTPESIEEEREKTMDEVAWYREYLLKIISTDGQAMHQEWIHFYDQLPKDNIRKIFISIDLAISEKESADYTAIVVAYVYGYNKKMKIYIQPDPINTHVAFPEQIELIKALIAVQKGKNSRVKIFIEENAYQKAIVQLLESQKYDVEGVQSRIDKLSRLRLVTPFVKDGLVVFPEKGCEDLIEQLVGFGKEKHDDLADAFSMLILKIVESCPITGDGIIFG